MAKLDITTAKSAEIQAALRQAVLRGYGDKVENGTKIHATRGWHYVEIPGVLKVSFRREYAPTMIRLLRAGPKKESE